MTTTKLTGASRCRVLNRFFKPDVLVLQVQYAVKGFEHDMYGLTRDVDYTGWRDATVEDLTVFEELDK